MDEISHRNAGGRRLGLALVLVMGAWLAADALAVERSSRTSRTSTQATSGSGSESAKIAAKLDQILANQETILKRFDDVMEELRIVKVRATINR